MQLFASNLEDVRDFMFHLIKAGLLYPGALSKSDLRKATEVEQNNQKRILSTSM